MQWDAVTGRRRPAGNAESLRTKSGPAPLLDFGGGGSFFYAVGPQDFYTIYNENPLFSATVPVNGGGETLAVVEDSDVNPADIVSFRSQFGLPAYPPTPNNTQGGVGFINGIHDYCEDPGIQIEGNESEADIDVEWIGVAAPAAIIAFVSCADTSTTFGVDLAAMYVVNNLASAVSAFSYSYGACEAQLGSGAGFYYDLWQQAVAEGQTPVVSAGDTGDDMCDRGNGRGPHGQDIGETGLSVSGMASTPYNVAAGGTDFSDTYSYFGNGAFWYGTYPYYQTAARYVPEMAWDDTCSSPLLLDYYSRNQGINYPNGAEGLCNDTTHFPEHYPYTYLDGGSGGISTIYGLPSWQSVYGVGLNGNYTSTSNRNLPDISLFAADGLWSHVLVFCESDVAPCDYSNDSDAYALAAGGTSFVAPQLAGIVGLVNQATGVRQGQANYNFYSLATLEYGTPGAPNTSTTVPSLYTCEGSNFQAIIIYGNGGIFPNCMFYNVNRTDIYEQFCINGDSSGCFDTNNDQPCATGTPNCYINTNGDRYGLLSTSSSTFQGAFPTSFGYSAATGLGSINVANLVLNWGGTPGDFYLSVLYDPGASSTIISADGFINCPSVCSHAYAPGSIVTLSVPPMPGYTFTGWNGACSGTGYCNVIMNSNLSVGGSWAPIASGSYTLSVTVTGSGSVSSADGLIHCPGTCSAVYQQNSQVTLNTTPGSGSVFGGWIGPCTGTASCNISITQNYSVTGEFTLPVQFVPITPCRLVDTRGNNDPIRGGTSRNFPVPQLGGCNIPTTATAYSLNVTVAPERILGYLTIWPTGEDQPFVSTMNSPDGRTKANAAIVPAGYQGAVSVYVSDSAHLILDIDGYFEPANSQTLQFYRLAPCRVVDTRSTGSNLPPGLGPPTFHTNESRPLPILSSSCFQGLLNTPVAYSFNVTVAPSPPGQSLNYLTIWPTGETQPYVSTLNNPTATVVANAAIVPAAANGDVSVYTYNSTDVIIDTNGYFATAGTGGYSFYPVAPCRAYDSRNNNGQPFTGERTVPIASSPCEPPNNAQAYVFNATVVPSGSLGYLTLWPDGSQGGQPMVSTLNAYDGFITSNMAIVPNLDGSTDAFAAAGYPPGPGSGYTQLILDIAGYFAP